MFCWFCWKDMVVSVSEFFSGGAGKVCFYNTYAVEFLAPRCSGFLRWPPRVSSRAGATDAEEEWGRGAGPVRARGAGGPSEGVRLEKNL